MQKYQKKTEAKEIIDFVVIIFIISGHSIWGALAPAFPPLVTSMRIIAIVF